MPDNRAILDEFLHASQNGNVLLLYYGMMSREVHENLMSALKLNLNRNPLVPAKYRRRAYSIADECITNIFQYYNSTHLPASFTGISAYKKDGQIDFIFTNTVKEGDREKLENHLKQIYNRPPEKIKEAFTSGINEELEENQDKAGLGLIIVSQRALGNFDFHFEKQNDGNFLFHLKISLDLHS